MEKKNSYKFINDIYRIFNMNFKYYLMKKIEETN